jgi:hypothetical protein
VKENNNPIVIYQPKKGLIPTIKSALFGDQVAQQQVINQVQPFLKFLFGSHNFARRELRCLVNLADNNPIVSGIIQKILFAQSNINFIPYRGGKPYKSGTFDFDVLRATTMLLKTGTVFIWKKEIIGFGTTLEVWNTLDVLEYRKGGKYYYTLMKQDGYNITVSEDELIIIKLSDISNERLTRFGLSPLQIAMMPMEALEQMYITDTSLLKNKGADIMITNDSEMPLLTDEQKSFDDAINERIAGARNAGKVATSQAKLRVLNLGRSAKELSLWDGYPIKLRDICNVFQVNSSSFNDVAGTTFNNVAEAEKSFYNNSVIPFTRLITNNKELQKELGYQIYLDTSNIDSLQEAQSLRNEKNKVLTDAIINLNQQVKNGVINVEIAIEILVSEWGYDLEEATKLIQVPKQLVNESN